MKNSILCLANSYQQADLIIRDLQSAGFDSTAIPVLTSDTPGTRDFGHVKASKAPEGAAGGAILGGVTGGIVGLLAGVGTLAIPGLGALIAAGGDEAAKLEQPGERQIEDAGPGLPPELHARLGQQSSLRDPPLKRSGGGIGGLGLAIAQRVALLHGGSLLPLPAPQGGTRLCLALPLAA